MKNLLYLIIAILIGFSIFFIIKNSDSKLPNIDKTPLALRPLRDKYVAMLDAKDPNSIFKIVDSIQGDPELSLNCHNIAHDIGHKAYELYGFSEAMTFDNPNHVKHALVQNICAGGYMHGILEQLSLHEPGFLKNPEMICNTISTETRASCFHGMGHVYMIANNYNPENSILGCRVIKEKMDMYRCFEGVRMEQFWGSTADKNQNSINICSAVQNDEKPTCFLYSSFGYLKAHPREYSNAASLCKDSNIPEMDKQFCLKGLGMTMMSKQRGQNMETSEIYVDGFSAFQRLAFYQGLTGYARLSGISFDEITQTCELLKNDVDVCIEALEGYK